LGEKKSPKEKKRTPIAGGELELLFWKKGKGEKKKKKDDWGRGTTEGIVGEKGRRFTTGGG